MSGLALAPAPRAQRLQGSARARRRFWHDEKRFKGTGEKSLVQRALLALGGVRTGGNVKAAPVQVSGTERCWGGGRGGACARSRRCAIIAIAGLCCAAGQPCCALLAPAAALIPAAAPALVSSAPQPPAGLPGLAAR
jgi:hypothetical protein